MTRAASRSAADARAAERERDAERARIRIELWRLALPVLWFGMVAAISFIEAPLKFQAPGITIPLGLGIGRLVFATLNIVEGAILLTLTVLSFWPVVARIAGARLLVWFGLILVFAGKVVFVRPPLNARTDLVLAGADPGQSPWHYVYIACDVATLVLLVVFAVLTARAILRSPALVRR
ncbi:hypothetical protein MUN76_14375 [Leucobacter rhizosphaerae]|uniref:Uncharacterized protein n=1 Tax=Leucobacter rhizosphaerae TaxID=2932245 RepID=A0ABY4FVA8_9MICO|nr:hypothetical protein [Leucobacter rhizosphaerae]UOQ60205.1 hypothetical protein MUN76_14375 [Leucobacter rhizosphaerae]